MTTKNAPKVLVVSNQLTTGPLWTYMLQQQNISVVHEADPADAIDRLAETIPDLVIVDVTPPDQAISLISHLRQETSVPVLLLTRSESEEFLLRAYEAGADDCIVKPVSASLFLAKVKVWLRRTWSVPVAVLAPLTAGNLRLLPAERAVVLSEGKPIRLTSLEFRLLYTLMSRPDYVVTIEELNQRVWGYSDTSDTSMLKNMIYRLRRKIEADPSNPRWILTVAGAGYQFVTR
jgi:DNA-binding response OmpR family regulator